MYVSREAAKIAIKGGPSSLMAVRTSLSENFFKFFSLNGPAIKSGRSFMTARAPLQIFRKYVVLTSETIPWHRLFLFLEMSHLLDNRKMQRVLEDLGKISFSPRNGYFCVVFTIRNRHQIYTETDTGFMIYEFLFNARVYLI